MPIITVKLARGRTSEQKQEFVESVTKEAVKTLHEVMIYEQYPNNYMAFSYTFYFS